MSPTPQRIEIPRFPGGKRLAVTTSWDDGHVYDRWIVEVFNDLGLKGTFNLNSGTLSRTGIRPEATEGPLDVAEVAALFAGHEVAVHTVTHPCLDRLDPAQIVTEVQEDRRALEALVGYPVRGMAYPCGAYDARVIDVLRMLGIVYSRTVESGITHFPPAEPLSWGATMHVISTSPAPVPERWEAVYSNPWASGVFFVWGHSYEFADDRPAIRRLFTPLAGKPDVWYCTNIELFDYEAARQRLVIAVNKATVYNPSAISVTISVDGTLSEAGPGVTRVG